MEKPVDIPENSDNSGELDNQIAECSSNCCSHEIKDESTEDRKSQREPLQEAPQAVVKQELSSDAEDLPGSGSLERRLTRARLVRRRTLALYDNQVKAFVSRKAPQLFESAFLVELKRVSDDVNCSPRCAFKPIITFRFPSETTAPISPPELFFPDFSHNPLIEPNEFWRGDEEFVIALTNHIAERKNAYCIKFLPTRNDEAVSPCVFVVISPIKSANFYLDLARNAVAYAKSSSKSLECFLKSVFNQPFPQKRGSCLVVVEKGTNGTKRRLEIKNLGTAIGKRGISEVMQRMSPEIVVCVIAALLGDQRVLIAGSTVGEVAQAVQCLEALLLPLVWPHTYVPVVPDNLTDLAHNPTPYLMGILRSNLLPLRDLIVDDTNNNDNNDKIQVFRKEVPNKEMLETIVKQMDFMFVDIDNGLINPRPEHFDCSKDRDAWRTQSAQAYAQKMGIPKKASANLIKGFKGAMANGVGPGADVKVENAMLHWYALLFGHYKSAGANTEWGDKIKAKLITAHPNPTMRPYLAYLCETAMFTEWVEKRQRSDSSPPLGEEVCGSEEALNRKLDEISTQQLHSSSNSSKPFSSLVTKVSNVLSFTGSRKK
ncbi:unnamed protein product, partial [Mesorhabditis belari]|uniref:UDENN domain-containing protein n=1 Tax=Mesorhabditis belari TaxID=2138241 RepID=A0AAF3FP28_9BILA